MSKNIIIKHEQLPIEEKERTAFLRNYFCETLVTLEKSSTGWCLHLSRPTQKDYYVDPNIESGISWWNENFHPIDIPKIPFALNRGPLYQLSIEDSWTVYSWSHWLKDNSTQQTITLLHVDDHNDMMTPRIGLKNDKWIDSISGNEFDLLSPESVKAAIKSGSIGIGSFMAPFIHLLPNLQIRHLCNTEYSTVNEGEFLIYPKLLNDSLLIPDLLRPALEIIPVSKSIGRENGRPYLVTNNTTNWIKDIPEGPILLHIDMDYFNNRFNGDSDWIDNGTKYDPPVSTVLYQIKNLFESIRQSGIRERIQDITIALSPGFFPTEMWPESIETVKNEIAKL